MTPHPTLSSRWLRKPRPRTGLTVGLAGWCGWLWGVCVVITMAMPAHAADLPTIASTSLCADQYALGLADPDQIVALSWQATDPHLSRHHARAVGAQQIRGTAEEVLRSGADIALVNAFGSTATTDMLERFDVEVVPIPLPGDWAGIFETTERVAAAIGQTERGRRVVAQTRARLEALTDRLARPGLSAAYLRPEGGSAGTGTTVDTVITGFGMDNAATRAGRVGWTTLPLEILVADPPDLYITSFFSPDFGTTGTQFARHPVARRLMADRPVIAVPGSAWVCSGWFLIDAVAALADGLDAHGLREGGE